MSQGDREDLEGQGGPNAQATEAQAEIWKAAVKPE